MNKDGLLAYQQINDDLVQMKRMLNSFTQKLRANG